MAAVRRARLANTGRDRPGWLRGCDGVRRGQRAGARRRDPATPGRTRRSGRRSGVRAGPCADGRRRSPSPGKVASDGGSRIAIADTGNDRVLVCDLDGTVARSSAASTNRRACASTVNGSWCATPSPGQVRGESIFTSGERHVLASGAAFPVGRARAPGRPDRDRRSRLAPDRRRPRSGGAPWRCSPEAGRKACETGRRTRRTSLSRAGSRSIDGGAIAFADSEVSALRVLRDGKVETLVGTGPLRLGRPTTAIADRAVAASARRGGTQRWGDRGRRHVQLADPHLGGRRASHAAAERVRRRAWRHRCSP